MKTRNIVEQLKLSLEIYLDAQRDLTDDPSRIEGVCRLGEEYEDLEEFLSEVEHDPELSSLEVPIIPNLDKLILEKAMSGNLQMDHWHCGTTHCRAGWAIVFGGEPGRKLEEIFGPNTAGQLIYEASTGRLAPNFMADNKEALNDLRRCAELQRRVL